MNETDFKIYEFYQNKEKAYNQLINELTLNGEVSEKQARNFMLKVKNFNSQNKDFLYMFCYSFYYEHNPNPDSKEISKKFLKKIIFDEYPEETINKSRKGIFKLSQKKLYEKDFRFIIFLILLLIIIFQMT